MNLLWLCNYDVYVSLNPNFQFVGRTKSTQTKGTAKGTVVSQSEATMFGEVATKQDSLSAISMSV